jgi:predicted DNA-binding transcriptional regulator YafY
MERVTQLLSVLSAAAPHAVSADRLLEVVVYGADSLPDRRDQLRRDVRQLEALGWAIGNVAGPGEPARYRLTATDTRLRVAFTPAQRAELLRAAQAARLAQVATALGGTAATETAFEAQVAHDSQALSAVQRAVAQRCLLHLTYRDRPRTVSPHALHLRRGGWYLTGQEVGTHAAAAAPAKTFAVARMSDVRLGEPKSAPEPAQPSRPQLDPITWQVDPPVEVTVETTPEHRPHVESMLGPAQQARPGSGDGLEVLTIPVTHRAAFRRRLYELGTRVRLLGPDEVCAQVRAELRAIAGES